MFKRLLLLASLCTQLCGCLGAAVVAGGTAASMVLYDERPISVMVTDQKIEHIASKSLDENASLKGHYIDVTSLNQRVLLTGRVASNTQRVLAYRLVKNVPQVLNVYNQITVSSEPSLLQNTQDAWLTNKVRLALMNTKGLHSNQIRITTYQGVVYLMGILTQHQQHIATQTARKVPGAHKIVTLFEVAH